MEKAEADKLAFPRGVCSVRRGGNGLENVLGGLVGPT